MKFQIVKDSELEKYNLKKEDIILPHRKTKNSAGYDFHTPIYIGILP